MAARTLRLVSGSGTRVAVSANVMRDFLSGAMKLVMGMDDADLVYLTVDGHGIGTRIVPPGELRELWEALDGQSEYGEGQAVPGSQDDG